MRFEVASLLPLLAMVACGPSGMRNVKFEGDALTGGTGSGGTGGGPGTGGVGGTGGFGGGGSGGFGGGSGGGGRGGVVGANGGTGGSVDAGRDLGPQDVAAPPDAMPDRPSSPDRPPADMAPPPPPDAAASLTIGLVSRWKLDEAMGIRTEDSAGNNVGTLSGATWQTTVYPGAKYPNPAALRFAGGDHVQLGVSGMPANNRAQSVALWLNYSSARDTEVCISLTDGGGGSRVKVGFKEGRLAAFKGGTDPTLVSVAPPPPGWHHLAYTFDGNTHRLYVDGTPRAMSTITPNNGSVTSARLGGNTDGSESFTGLLDEVRVYNRALSAAEVTALHSGEQ